MLYIPEGEAMFVTRGVTWYSSGSEHKICLPDLKICLKVYLYANLTRFREMERYLTVEYRIIDFRIQIN